MLFGVLRGLFLLSLFHAVVLPGFFGGAVFVFSWFSASLRAIFLASSVTRASLLALARIVATAKRRSAMTNMYSSRSVPRPMPSVWASVVSSCGKRIAAIAQAAKRSAVRRFIARDLSPGRNFTASRAAVIMTAMSSSWMMLTAVPIEL